MGERESVNLKLGPFEIVASGDTGRLTYIIKADEIYVPAEWNVHYAVMGEENTVKGD